MKERPIVMSAEMVRAIFEDRKTMHRSVVKNRDVLIGGNSKPFTGSNFGTDTPGEDGLCPFGIPGDRLFVKEKTFVPLVGQSHVMQMNEGLIYAADRETCPHHYKAVPSIHMPRWVSRITLEIVSVKVERLQDISEEDVTSEGVPYRQCSPDFPIGTLPWRGDAQWYWGSYDGGMPPGHYVWTTDHSRAFESHWDSQHGKKPGCSWAENPYVWCLEFCVLAGEEKPPGPLIGANAVDLLHSLGVLPGQDWKDPETQEWLNASLGYKANGH